LPRKAVSELNKILEKDGDANIIDINSFAINDFW
jgi:hypothetical protein